MNDLVPLNKGKGVPSRGFWATTGSLLVCPISKKFVVYYVMRVQLNNKHLLKGHH